MNHFQRADWGYGRPIVWLPLPWRGGGWRYGLVLLADGRWFLGKFRRIA